jgi:molybdenum cofactor synthesis domain-containing protein
MSTAGIIVIGNEVLSGKVDEENARYLIRELRDLGVQLMEISVIRDDVDRIAKGVRAMSAEYAHVFTSGGVGGTHDDVTFEGIARAFGVVLERNKDIADLLTRHYRDRINEHVLRMADLPRGADLVGLGSMPYPLVRVKNVYVFPGVPIFFRAKFDMLKPLLKQKPFVLRQIFVRVGEDQVARFMTAVQSAHPDLEIGSYPRFDTDEYKVKITVEGRDRERVDLAAGKLLELIDPAWIVSTA